MPDNKLKILIDDVSIEEIKAVKYLGLIVDHKLN